ncbi:MAG: TrmH family RNA methyltransferase, partial [Acidobacteriaceae bacterium]
MLSPAEQDRLHVVLVNSRNPLNIGAAARALANFGFPHLRVVHPYPVAFQEAKSAVNAEPVLAAAEQFEHLPKAIADCTLVVGTTGAQRNLLEPVSTLEAAAPMIQAQLRSGSKVAILFGSEKVGHS